MMGHTFVLPERCEIRVIDEQVVVGVRVIDEQVVVGAPTIRDATPAKRPIETASVQLVRENKMLCEELARQYQKAERRLGCTCTDEDAKRYVNSLLMTLQAETMHNLCKET